MNRFGTTVGVLAAVLMAASVASAAPPQGAQSDAWFAGSYAAKGVVNVSATTQKISCYAPEVSRTRRCSSRTTRSPISASIRPTRCT
jgi:hypothetical protein